ncbi:MAG: Gfo/Idh/MocA family oxidoreductase, partial [Spirochaetia bacterium]|nr:Gfo/Idh/MocA family oxidoreductase [Spirochaetia bacterium]
MKNPIPFALIGGGWRADFFLRIAAALPEKFRAVGAFLRNADKRKAFESRWNIPAVSTLAELAALKPAYAVVSVPAGVAPDLIRDTVGQNLPVLTETPPAWDLAKIGELHPLVKQGAKIQVAEQYPFRPHYQAVSAVIASG